MRQVFEAFRLAFDQGRSQHDIARALGLSQSTVNDYLRRFRGTGLPWPVPPEIDEAAVEVRLFVTDAPAARGRAVPDGYQYTQFCRHYRTWADTLEPALRQVHLAGEKTFVDYAGLTMPVHDRATATVREAQLFVGALGASHLIFAAPTWTQSLPDWIGAHVHMVEYFGGVTALIVPDNLKAAVTQPCDDEPTVHATYQDFATHYGTAILPARAYHPRDKAKVETAVQIVEREIVAPLRHDVFHTLADLAHAIAYALERVNTRPFQKLAGSRRSVFEATERATLRPLPPTRYALCEWRTAKVNIDYHLSVDGHLYSVPYRLVGASVTVRLTASMVEVLHRDARVAVHPRSALKGRYTTEPTHRPKAHQRHLEWSPSRLIAWGTSIGPATGQMVDALLARYAHPEQRYRTCLGLFALKRRYDAVRLEAACRRACDAGTISYRSVKSILVTRLEAMPLEPPELTTHLPATHDNIRGAAYYDTADVSLSLTPDVVC